MNVVRKVIEWYFFAPNEPRGFMEIVGWWELRRIVYNFVIGSVGLVSLILFFIFAEASHKIPPGDDLVEPVALLFAPIFINVCYTAGEILELIFGRIWEYNEGDGPWATTLLKLGTGTSLVLVLFPSVYWGIYLILLRLNLAK